MHRFFVPPNSIGDASITFPPNISRQIARVLRIQRDDRVIILDNLGWEYEVRLAEVGRELVEGEIISKSRVTTEPNVKVGLYISLTQREKYEWILQKCTEVGAAEFTPMITSRSMVQNLGEVGRKRERWENILQEAAEQSGRGFIPTLRPALSFHDALQDCARYSLRLIPWEQEKVHPLNKVMMTQRSRPITEFSVAIFIGCEGGFSKEEIEKASEASLQSVTLGARILRMETAAIVATALVIDAAENGLS
jgi:16S rRNA (uracil1498-N3)-methyltransferase